MTGGDGSVDPAVTTALSFFAFVELPRPLKIPPTLRPLLDPATDPGAEPAGLAVGNGVPRVEGGASPGNPEVTESFGPD